MIPLHLGALHPVEQWLTLLLAFGPFVVLGLVILAAPRRGEPRQHRGRDRRTLAPVSRASHSRPTTFSVFSALSSRSPIRPSILPPTSGMPTLIAQVDRLGRDAAALGRGARCRSCRRLAGDGDGDVRGVVGASSARSAR